MVVLKNEHPTSNKKQTPIPNIQQLFLFLTKFRSPNMSMRPSAHANTCKYRNEQQAKEAEWLGPYGFDVIVSRSLIK